MDVPLPAEIEEVVRRKVEAGEYPTVAALVEEALFLLVERDFGARQRELLERLPSAFDGGPESSPEGEGS